ncbi:hypothetical protein [Haloferula sp. BvORR071]|uniref:hypothetical protein n=1 Tax=Haloferula sp. BvORR071 TaxID=1396141 RepID=UPI0005560ED2|nr:hypothetical protein [Haloferula sp. BvORR071]
MDHEFQDIEDSLKGMRPAAPDAACLGRLLAAVEGRLQKNDLSMAGVESRLAAMAPVAPGPEVFERMLNTVSRVPFPVSDKVVLFPGAAKPAAAKAASRRPWYAAAAAVAVAGAFSAMMVEKPSTGIQIPVTTKTEESRGYTPVSGPGAGNGKIVRASTGLQEASDQGLGWRTDGKPMRVVKLKYMDTVQVTQPDGKVVEMQVPREELLLVPEKID